MIRQLRQLADAAARVPAAAAAFATTARRRFVANNLDQEPRIGVFQWFYYPMFVVDGLYTWLVADEYTKAITGTLGPLVAAGWLLLTLSCPIIALTGRVLTYTASKAPPGQPNPGVAGAYLQLTGDGGVWFTILVYFVCFANTFEWGQPLYTTFYFLMGIPGGFMFTLRSVYRLRQVRRRVELLRQRRRHRGGVV